MKRDHLTISGNDIPCITTGVAIVGSGAASLNAAVRLSGMGVNDLLVITEKLGAGTSANAGSDKQTYYRLNPSSLEPDGIMEMAKDLYNGHCMHGDIALVEAALSQRSFYHLVECGVAFPQNAYGELVGFQTDHDKKSRGTSAGPKTSIQMVEMLYQKASELNVAFLEHCTIVDILTTKSDGKSVVAGMIALEKGKPLIIQAEYVVYGTGGPGALYGDSVYPYSQFGALGAPIKAGAVVQNLAESQFGIASKDFRWNLSGSYQQVLPRYISTDAWGKDEKEFLSDCFPGLEKQLEAQFLKGYEWPFDVRKVNSFGSSLIDLLVFKETIVKGRKVFLDFRQNPLHRLFKLENLPAVIREYLEKSDALEATPIERLQAMNSPAYELFRENKIDLEKGPLAIAVCHQHCNGGLKGSIWWESSITGFFPVGECNGTHGIYRPGGSALNSGQCGSLRAAEMICHRLKSGRQTPRKDLPKDCIEAVAERIRHLESVIGNANKIDVRVERETIRKRMSSTVGIVRNLDSVKQAIAENKKMQKAHSGAGISEVKDLTAFLRNEDLLITEEAFLKSAEATLTRLAGGRGSWLIGDIETLLAELTGNHNRLSNIPDNSQNDRILEYFLDKTLKGKTRSVRVRSIPEPETWFEKVWKDFREDTYLKEGKTE